MHFTYNDQIDTTSLHQGDIINRTEDIEKLLEELHPHYYKKSDYKYFMVITQTCDLVRRDGHQCAAKYLTIASVRPIALVVQRQVEKYQYDSLEKKLKILSESVLVKLEQFIERLLNNNEAEYFYLHKERDSGLNEDCCAFLRLTIDVVTKKWTHS